MKLQSIELRNFLSHEATSWEPNGARLASIVGPNGAGKSSLLDGILYALYDAARAKTDQLVRLGATDMSAAVTFDFGGETYRVVRGRTTKSGGKSFLEFQVHNGDDGFVSLSGDDIRSTQAAIEKLLGLDATTFTTAAFLRQGEADSFISATPAERKRVLGQVLGLERYAAGEAHARELARDVEARIAAARDFAERLEDEVAVGREGFEAELEQAREQLLVVAGVIAESTRARDKADEDIRELEARQAAAKAIADQVASLEREKAAAREAWLAAQARGASARQEIERLERLLADAELVDQAVADVPAAQAEVDRLTALEAEDRRLQRELADMERAIRDLEIPYTQRVATWQAEHAAAARKAAELEEHAKAGAAVCDRCGQAINDATARAQLTDARAALVAIGERPQEPISIARARAGKARHEERIRELGWDPAALMAARTRLYELASLAARADSLAAAAASIERERATVAGVEAEQERISARGRALAAEIADLQPAIAESDMGEAALASARKARASIVAELEQLESSRRQLERAIATGEATLQALEAKAAEAAGIRGRIAGDELEARRLRREVEALGVRGIPARIIAGVLPELERYANELLAELRPGMTLSIDSQRAKKSGDGVIEALDLVVRDAVGERPLALFSGGERMSVSLALAVGLSRLVARRAGARIETLVVDEPDGLDREARRAFGQALRVIAHRGDLARVVLVSHHEDLAEFGDATYQVTKGASGSTVELVA